MIKTCTCRIEVDGREAFAQYRKLRILQPFATHQRFDLHLSLEELPTVDALGLVAFSNRYAGKEITFSIGLQKDLDSQKFTFKGIVTRIKLSKGYNTEKTIIVSGNSPTILLEDGKQTQSFTRKTLKDIATDITKNYPENLLRFNNSPKLGKEIGYTVQYQEPPYVFMQRLATRHGEWFFYDGEELHFGRNQEDKVEELWLGAELGQFDLAVELRPMKFRQAAFDLTNSETYEGKSENIQLLDVDGLSEQLITVSESLYAQAPLVFRTLSATSKQELEEAMMPLKGHLSSQVVVLKGEGQHLGLRPGKLIQVNHYSPKGKEKAKESLGEYCILDIEHHLDNAGNYHNSFTAIPARLQFPRGSIDMPPPTCPAQLAFVRDNEDPQGLGRVRVQFLWQSGSEMTPWISRTTPLGGENQGIYFVPEIDELVMVGFEDNHPEHPFVLGSLYHGKAKSGFDDTGNPHKVIQTRSGNRLSLQDESGKETIRIANREGKNEIRLTLEEGGKLIIHSEGKMQFSGNSIELDAHNITLKASESIELQALEVKAKAKKAFSAEATEMKLEAQAKASLSSKAQVEISATAEAKVQAGLIRLN